jgi:hypothetical protein
MAKKEVSMDDLSLTPGRVKSFIGNPGPGGHKIYLTARNGRSWVEFGGRGVAGNPLNMEKQPNLGFETEVEAWAFAERVLSEHPALRANPLGVFRLYDYAPTAQFDVSRSRRLASFVPVERVENPEDPPARTPALDIVQPAVSEETPGKRYTLVGADGKSYLSDAKGTFGGHRRMRIYGRLDCKSALSFIARGYYVEHRVFFKDEATAISAGYRPCGKCMRVEYARWKSGQS